MPSRQFIFFLALGCLFGGMLLTYSRLEARYSGVCAGDPRCMKLTKIREKLTRPGNEWGRLVSTQGSQGRRPNLLGQTDEEACQDFPDTNNILMVMKTGASEAYSKIPTQTITGLRCLSDYLIYSDMDQVVAGEFLLDSLDTVSPKVQKDNPDFDFYLRQRSCPLDQETCNKHEDSTRMGWSLDKYKNIHIAEKAFRSRPGYDWYLYVDADTYVFWPTLVEWLKNFDPKQSHYLGSAAMLSGFPFAHGGSGYLMSRKLMQQMFENNKKSVARLWDAEAAKTCCGDYNLARALQNRTEVQVENMVSSYTSSSSNVLLATHRY